MVVKKGPLKTTTSLTYAWEFGLYRLQNAEGYALSYIFLRMQIFHTLA